MFQFLRIDRRVVGVGLVAECSIMDMDCPYGERALLSSFVTGLSVVEADKLQAFFQGAGMVVRHNVEEPESHDAWFPPRQRKKKSPDEPDKRKIPPSNSADGLFAGADTLDAEDSE